MDGGRSIRILVAGIRWPPETFLARLIRGLADSGCEVIIASHRRPGSEWRNVDGVRFIWAPTWSGSIPLRLVRVCTMLIRAGSKAPKEVARLAPAVQGRLPDRFRQWNRVLPIAGREFDVLYLPWNLSGAAYWPLFELGKPVVISCRGSQVNVVPHTPGRADVAIDLRRTLERAAAVHCVSDAMLDTVQHYGVRPEKARVIRPAVDPDMFQPNRNDTGSGANELHIVTTGSLIWRKGLEYLLQAIRLVLDRGTDVHLEIIGDGPELQRVRYTINDLDLTDRVTLRGQIMPADVVRVLQRADVFVLSSLSEGISNAVLEAMSCALPVVTTQVGGMREAVTDGVEGFVVPPRDPAAMAEAMIALARDPRLRGAMGAAGRERVVRDFALSSQVSRFVDLFQGTIPR